MSKQLVFIFLLTSSSLGLLGHVEAQALPNDTELANDYNKVAIKMDKLFVFKHGEECDYQGEQRLFEISKQIDSGEPTEKFIKEMINLSNSKGFCNPSKAVQCKANGKCDCMSEPAPGMDFQAELVEPGKCRLSKGSRCRPADGADSDLVCKSGTQCLLKSDKKGECVSPTGSNMKGLCECF